ncbi:MAG: PD40 domain-containing protein [Chloracidobacterium sp.]|nr:PD40 domain-containing protein [Chloracidobacterium sp.]
MSLKTQSFTFEGFLLDTKEKVLVKDGKPLPVTPKAFLLLSILVENHGLLVEKNDLISQVWPDSFVEEGNLTFTIGLLRKTLGDDSRKPRFIETVPRRGYRFIAEISEAPVEIATQPRVIEQPTTKYRRYAAFAALCIFLLCTLATGTWLAKTQVFGSASIPILDANFRSEKFSSSGKTLHAVISPDGNLAAYIDETGGKLSVWLRKLETSENTLLVPPSDEFYFGLVFANDGQSLYFVRKPPGGNEREATSIYRISLLGGVPEKIIAFTEGWISLSPDDRQISFVRCQYKENDFCSLMIADTTGQNERKIHTTAKRVRISDNQFSPDGKSIVFASGVSDNGAKDFHLAKIDLQNGMESAISSPAFFNIHSLKLLPDGETLLVTAQETLDGQSKLWQISMTTGETRSLTKDSASFRGISLTKDASRMMSTQVSEDFQLFLSSQGLTKGLTRAREAVFSPDGNIVYFTQDGNIWGINREGGEQRQLTNSPHKDHSPCVSPDGSTVFFNSTRSGTNQVWRMNSDGSNQTAMTKTEGGLPVFVSPDGQWVYYEANKLHTLWKVSTKTGEEVQVSDHKVHRPALSPDGTLAAFFTRKSEKEERTSIAVMQVADKNIVKVFDFADARSLPVRIAWSMDNRTFSYVTWSEQGNTLWEQSLDDAEPRHVADLGDKEVEYYSLAPDNNSYIFTRGEWLHTAVLIDGLQ